MLNALRSKRPSSGPVGALPVENAFDHGHTAPRAAASAPTSVQPDSARPAGAMPAEQGLAEQGLVQRMCAERKRPHGFTFHPGAGRRREDEPDAKCQVRAAASWLKLDRLELSIRGNDFRLTGTGPPRRLSRRETAGSRPFCTAATRLREAPQGQRPPPRHRFEIPLPAATRHQPCGARVDFPYRRRPGPRISSMRFLGNASPGWSVTPAGEAEGRPGRRPDRGPSRR